MWRKPEAGMLLEAGMMFGIDLASSIMVGDKASDMEAAARAGLRHGFLVDPSNPAAAVTAPHGTMPAKAVRDLASAIDDIFNCLS